MRHNPTSTRYLLRFDDLCPTANWEAWSEIEASLKERNLRPIVAVVPDNRDPKLKVAPAVEDFWGRVRAWQTWGWTIALHGYQHRYVIVHPGIVTPKKKSEFAGLSRMIQEEKLRFGIEIFRRQGIQTSVWVAPSNSFDATTVSLLRQHGISIISDGYCRFPFVCPQNLFWVPQQLFGFRPAPPGVWTVCYHHNHWTAADLSAFRRDLDRFGPEISSLDEVVQRWGQRRSWVSRFLCTSPRLSPLVVRCQLKLWSYVHLAGVPVRPRVRPAAPVVIR